MPILKYGESFLKTIKKRGFIERKSVCNHQYFSDSNGMQIRINRDSKLIAVLDPKGFKISEDIDLAVIF